MFTVPMENDPFLLGWYIFMGELLNFQGVMLKDVMMCYFLEVFFSFILSNFDQNTISGRNLFGMLFVYIPGKASRSFLHVSSVSPPPSKSGK